MGANGKVAFDKHRLVIGRNAPVFSVADTVGFGFTTEYAVPIQIEQDKDFCLTASGTSLQGNAVCAKLNALERLPSWSQG